MTDSPIETFDDFACLLGGKLELEGWRSWEPDLSLDDDLGFDSLLWVEMLVALGELGAAPRTSDLRSLATLGDAYAIFAKRSGDPSSE